MMLGKDNAAFHRFIFQTCNELCTRWFKYKHASRNERILDKIRKKNSTDN